MDFHAPENFDTPNNKQGHEMSTKEESKKQNVLERWLFYVLYIRHFFLIISPLALLVVKRVITEADEELKFFKLNVAQWM